MLSISLFSVIAPLLFKTLIANAAFTCEPKPVYEPGSISRVVNYNNKDSNPAPAWDFSLEFTITTTLAKGDHKLSGSMDTGSTGVAVGATLMGLTLEDVQKYENGSESLSGGTFWEGYWIPASEVNFTFADAGLTAKIPILAVMESSTCHNFDDSGKCTKKTDSKKMPDDVHYVGVGFGRNRPGSEQVGQDKVPFTNIAFIDGNPVDDKLHPGYIITTSGVEIGLTSENVQNFHTTQLQQTHGSSLSKDWAQVEVSLAVDDSDWNHGSALFDTGLHQAYIRLDEETTAHLHKHTIRDNGLDQVVLTDNSTVHVRVGKGPDYIADYTVKVDDTPNPVRPYQGEFRTEAASNDAFINTGRFFYKGFEVMLDAECGWFGLRQKKA